MTTASTSSGPVAGEPTGGPDVTDVMDPGMLADPFGEYGRLRDRCPVSRGSYLGDDLWLVTGYEELREVLGDQRFVHDVVRSVPGWQGGDPRQELARKFGLPDELVDYMTPALLSSDPPEHTRLRRIVTRAFTVREVTRMRPFIQGVVDRLIDELPGHATDGVVDLVQHFAHPVSMEVICEFLGIPEEERPQWYAWVEGPATDPAWLTGTFPKVVQYLRDMVSDRRARPSGDLISELLRIHHEEGDRLSDKELVDTVILLIHAGQDVTAHLITNGALALLTHPDQFDLVRADPALWPAAVTEMMRWCSPSLTSVLRYASEDMEIAGQRISKGDALMPVFGSANRDPRAFPEPDRFDITREEGGKGEPHIGFGRGNHFCPGAVLARVEVETALTRLLVDRYPALAPAADPDELPRIQAPGQWRLVSLPVRLGPSGTETPEA
ncbi:MULTISPECIES: cytochrome P450 [unclassified Streptomyces]|uniref:cytochrome P450 family protein n=1 Tax=unclassified Streptomyces TaxID=2593676 RepID=UPI003818FE22